MWKPVIININMLGDHVIQSHTEKEKKKNHQDMFKPALNSFFDKLFENNPKKRLEKAKLCPIYMN